MAAQEITVIIGDANTTVDFTGTNLKGNNGKDWAPSNGDVLTGSFDGTNWYCTVTNATSTMPSVNTTAVGNVGTGEDNLMTYAIPASVLNANGVGVRVTAWGTFANNADAKTLKFYFGSLASTQTLTTSEAGNWEFNALIFRTGVDAQDYKITFQQDATTELHDRDLGALTEDDGAAITVKCTGEATSNNDIVQEGMLVEFIR
jgi:hypothetical protein